MLPNIGFIPTYGLFIVIGVIVCFFYLRFYYGKEGKRTLDTVELNAIFAIIIGIVFANLFQNLYDFIDHPNEFKWSWGLTFFGGLIGGVGSFLLLYFFFFKKKYGAYLEDLIVVAPASICIAHGFGRIGCFLTGCCYGEVTDSWMGVHYPDLPNGVNVLPVNLFEAIFLIALSALLLFLALKYRFRYNFSIYMIAYGIWRFIIEYFRGDYRGSFIGGISPSQFWSIVIVLGGIAYAILMYLRLKKKKNQPLEVAEEK